MKVVSGRVFIFNESEAAYIYDALHLRMDDISNLVPALEDGQDPEQTLFGDDYYFYSLYNALKAITDGINNAFESR